MREHIQPLGVFYVPFYRQRSVECNNFGTENAKIGDETKTGDIIKSIASI